MTWLNQAAQHNCVQMPPKQLKLFCDNAGIDCHRTLTLAVVVRIAGVPAQAALLVLISFAMK